MGCRTCETATPGSFCSSRQNNCLAMNHCQSSGVDGQAAERCGVLSLAKVIKYVHVKDDVYKYSVW